MSAKVSSLLSAPKNWLWPDAASLIPLFAPLVRDRWESIRHDWAIYPLLAARPYGLLSTATLPEFHWQPSSLPLLHVIQQSWNDGSGHWLDWRHPVLFPLYRTTLTIAHFARLLAEKTEQVEPDLAWLTGMLIPQGWLMIAGRDPNLVVDCQQHREFKKKPAYLQHAIWGQTQRQLLQQAAREWNFHPTIEKMLLRLDLPLHACASHGLDVGYLAVMQLAVCWAEQAEMSFALSHGIPHEAAIQQLELNEDDLQEVLEEFQQIDWTAIWEQEPQDPRNCYWIPELLELSLEKYQPKSSERVPLPALYHDESEFEQELQTAKLESLAELAAGASHEINNPLAIISGQSQYLLRKESEEKKRQSLDAIIRQVERIHSILHDLMLFAKPQIPKRESIDLRGLVTTILEEHKLVANKKSIRLELESEEDVPSCWIDQKQTRTAIASLIQNALDAVQEQGWIRVRIESAFSWTHIIVEDSGIGPNAIQRKHMFDPFYSGRTSGRGRGLGLPIAWQLVRQQGGQLRYEALTDGPTRFVIELPQDNHEETVDRQSA